MMRCYGFVITDSGRELLAKLVAGSKLVFSKVLVGSGMVPDGVMPSAMTALSEPVAAGTSTTPAYDGVNVRMTIEYRSDLNGGLESGFWLREFGVFAFDPDKGEVLVFYGTLGEYPQYVNAASDTGVDVRRFPVRITIGEGIEVDTDYTTEAWMTAEDVEEYCTVTLLPVFLSEARELVDAHNRDATAHYSMQSSLADLGSRVSLLELMLNTDVSGNPFSVTFESLDGLSAAGVWNTDLKRMEF